MPGDSSEYYKLLNNTFMNIKNFEFLRDGLKYMGFGDKLNNELETKLKEQSDEFKLTLVGEFTKNGVNDKVNYILDFKKSDQTDMFFFNRYQATLKNENPELDRSQTFYVAKNSGITAKEAYNLLSGRAVNKDLSTKEGQPYNAWLQLDFQEKDKNDNYKVKQYHSGYGYDLELTVAKYPIREQVEPDQKASLLKSLEKGNLTKVTFVKEGKDEIMFVTANPQFKSLDIYDSKMQKQFQGIEKREKEGADKSQERKESQKQEVDDEGEPKKGKKTAKRKSIGV